MPMLFKYKAKNKNGEIKKGFFSSQEKQQVYDDLRKDGFTLIYLEKIESGKGIFGKIAGCCDKLQRITIEDKMIFIRHLAVMVEAGIALPRALEILKNQVRTPKFKKIVESIASDVRKGKTLASSMSQYPKVFNELFSNMIKAGEESGNLQYILSLLADHLEKEHATIAKVKGALIYPALILLVMIGIAAAMITMVIPKLAGIFIDMGISLPFTTRILINFSLWAKNNSVALIVDLAILLIILKIALSFKFGKRFVHLAQIRLPFFGNIFKKINSARFARVASSLIKSGINISQSLEITSGTLPNIYYRESMLKAAKDVQGGKTLHDALGKFESLYPLLVSQMTEIGEETGKSGEILSKLADFYEEDVDNLTKNISSIIEPVLMIIIGAAVCFFAVSMLMPMYSIIGAV